MSTYFTKYPSKRSEDGTYEISDLEVFAQCQRVDAQTGKVYEFDDEFIDDALAKFNERKRQGYRPPVHIGHHKPGMPPPPLVGFMEDMYKSKDPDGRTVVKARLTDVPAETYVKLSRKQLPYRSVEIRNPANHEFSSLALLDSDVPFHKFPLTVVEQPVDLAKATAAAPMTDGTNFSEKLGLWAAFNFAEDDEIEPSDPNMDPAAGGMGDEMDDEGGLEELLASLPPDVVAQLLDATGGDESMMGELAAEGPDVMGMLQDMMAKLDAVVQGQAAAAPKPDAPPILNHEELVGIVREQAAAIDQLMTFAEWAVGELNGVKNADSLDEAVAELKAEKHIPDQLMKQGVMFAEAQLLLNDRREKPITAKQALGMFFEGMTFAEPTADAPVNKPKSAINPPPATGALDRDAGNRRPSVNVETEEITRFAEEHPELSVAFKPAKKGEISGADAYRHYAQLFEELPGDVKNNYAGRQEFILDNMASALVEK